MLEFKDVSYVYGKNTPFEMTAVDHVSFAIKDNAVTGLIGHTGSGKSTLAQMTNALLKPTSGTVLLDGKDINAKDYDTPSVRFKVGLVFQYPEYQLFEETVYKDIAFGPHNMGLSDEEIDERVKNAAHFTGLTRICSKKARLIFRAAKSGASPSPALSPWIPKYWCLTSRPPGLTLPAEMKFCRVLWNTGKNAATAL